MFTNSESTTAHFKSKTFHEMEFAIDELKYHLHALEEALRDVHYHTARCDFYLNQVKDYNKKLNEEVL
jgi:hypothetical protein